MKGDKTAVRRFGDFLVTVRLPELTGPRGKHLGWNRSYARFEIDNVAMADWFRVEFSVSGNAYDVEPDLDATAKGELWDACSALVLFKGGPDPQAVFDWVRDTARRMVEYERGLAPRGS